MSLCRTNDNYLAHFFRPYVAESRIRNFVPNLGYKTTDMTINRSVDHQGKENTNFRKKEKEILDKVLDNSTYDRRIRPAGHQNDTSKLVKLLIKYNLKYIFNQILVLEVSTKPEKEYISYGGGNHQSEKGMVHFRRKKKEILDQILKASKYDRQIRPAGHVNDTSGCWYNFLDSSPLIVMNVCTKIQI